MKNVLIEIAIWAFIILCVVPMPTKQGLYSLLYVFMNIDKPSHFKQMHIISIFLIIFLARIYLGKGLCAVFCVMIAASLGLSYAAGLQLLVKRGDE